MIVGGASSVSLHTRLAIRDCCTTSYHSRIARWMFDKKLTCAPGMQDDARDDLERVISHLGLDSDLIVDEDVRWQVATRLNLSTRRPPAEGIAP